MYRVRLHAIRPFSRIAEQIHLEDLEGLKVHHALKQQRYCFDAIALGAHATLPYEFLGVTA